MHTLYSANHRWLLGWLRRRVGDPFDAADLVQDTFVRVLKTHTNPSGDIGSIPPGTPIREPRAYLATIAKSLMIDFFRRQTLERTYLEVLAALPPQEVPSLEDQAVLRSALMDIDTMLDGLGVKVKQAFLMAQCEDLPYAEIASRLGVSRRTVDNYLARAMTHCCLLLP
ncbi:sigma-70 family RNA polymerase sigma factor [Bordetella genomosp. 12]|uniref:RNA polymerase subunit sigma n=1 Tax=Bordetella genomosp. 12 TaxID=463035 RepID=A0A261VK22_9BORD|nr:sigma-70 family RNA polymerase sigma factor [Bordetella genomosp. 12]OZI74425.1 RNA polymerase subunit sigma [Bordetella genomosp. 12]